MDPSDEKLPGREKRTSQKHGGRLAAIDRLKSVKQGSARIIDAMAVKKEENVYDVVPLTDYQCGPKDNFVVDDNGEGYIDDDSEWWDQPEEQEEELVFSRRAQNSKVIAKNNNAGPSKPQKRISNLFLGTSKRKGAHSSHHVADCLSDSKFSVSETDILQELLGDFEPEKKSDTLVTETPIKPSSSQVDMVNVAFFGSSSKTKETYLESFNKNLPSSGKLSSLPDLQPLLDESSSTSNAAQKAQPSLNGLSVQNQPLHRPKVVSLPLEDEMETNAQRAMNSSLSSSTTSSSALSSTLHSYAIQKSSGACEMQDWRTHCATNQPLTESTSASSNAGPEAAPALRSDVDSYQKHSLGGDCGSQSVADDQILRMYLLDMYVHIPTSVLYLFGKTYSSASGSFVSCCVGVHNIERNLFILPREYLLDSDGKPTSSEVTLQDVYSEFLAMAKNYGISEFLSKPVQRKYAFEMPDIPSEGTYLKVKYSSKLPSLPETALKGKSFSHIFGTNTSLIELFLTKRKLMGPCWIDISNTRDQSPSFSWCKVERIVEDPKWVSKTLDAPDAPPLVIMSLSFRTVMNRKKNYHQIVAVGVMVQENFNIDDANTSSQKDLSSFTAISKLDNEPYPVDFSPLISQSGLNVNVCANESGLLSFLLAKIHNIDPDILVGHNILGFSLDILLKAFQRNSLPHWSKIGRLHRKEFPKMNHSNSGSFNDGNYSQRLVLSGRVVCDMYISSKELIKQQTYSLSELAQTQLNVVRTELDLETIPKMYATSKQLLFFLRHCENDAYLILTLCKHLQALALAKQITCLAGNTLSRTLQAGRAERNEFLLMHEFKKRKFICPDKEYRKKSAESLATVKESSEEAPQKSSRKKPTYAGGLVLEPKKGFYDQFILLLDFNSLYPSIIQEYNICFTTVDRQSMEGNHDMGIFDSLGSSMIDVPGANVPDGILPTILKTLVTRRRTIKNLIKEENNSDHPNQSKLAQYDIRQRALKLTANSMYGCLGASHSRFYCKPLAELITLKGREILQRTVDLVQQNLDLEVIYGDTDSIMINTKTVELSDVMQIGNRVKREVNKLYKLLEIEVDGVFKTMLLLKKKKYAALSISEKKDTSGNVVMVTEKETKGLDMVRRDWCDLSHDVGNYVLEQILAGQARDTLVENIHLYLRQVSEDVMSGKVPLEKFVINKGLTKSPEDYPDKKSQPHVQVALRMKSKGMNVQPHDTIPYVICQGSDPQPACRAYHPDELGKQQHVGEIEASPVLRVDHVYYLRSQIHPVVGRLCDPIEGTDNSILAECLGLDPAAYSGGAASGKPDADEVLYFGGHSQMSDEEKYKQVEKLSVRCTFCKKVQVFSGVFRLASETETTKSSSALMNGLTCCFCSCELPLNHLKNLLILSIRRHIDHYYQKMMTCDDSVCGNSTRQISVNGKSCLNPGCRGSMMLNYSDTALYTQLLYYQHLFDYNHSIQVLDDSLKEMANLVATNTVGFKEKLSELGGVCSSYLEKNSRSVVNLGSIFSF